MGVPAPITLGQPLHMECLPSGRQWLSMNPGLVVPILTQRVIIIYMNFQLRSLGPALLPVLILVGTASGKTKSGPAPTTMKVRQTREKIRLIGLVLHSRAPQFVLMKLDFVLLVIL